MYENVCVQVSLYLKAEVKEAFTSFLPVIPEIKSLLFITPGVVL